MDPLKVGLLGLGRGGKRLAKALITSTWCQLIAVASTKASRLEEFAAEHPGIATFNDSRSLIVSGGLDALFVALPPFLRGNYLNLAASRQLPVWTLPPPARKFEDAVALVRLFERVDCPLVVSRNWGIEPGLRPEFVSPEGLGRVFLCRGESLTCWSDDLDWRGDRVRAGGGVLLDRGYSLIDSMVQAMGMPVSVYAAAGGVAPKESRFPYDTEDTAVMVCHFQGGGLGTILCSWTTGPESWSFHLHGSGGGIHVDMGRVAVCDPSGTRILREQARPAEPLLAQVEEFLSGLCTSPRTLRSSMRQHLPTMAVMRAAYLSIRTGQPERPGQILEMHDLEAGRR